MADHNHRNAQLARTKSIPRPRRAAIPDDVGIFAIRSAVPLTLNPAVGLETATGFAARCNQGERLKPVRGVAAGRVGGPSGSVSALRSGCDTSVAQGPTAPQFVATAPESRRSAGRRGVPCVG